MLQSQLDDFARDAIISNAVTSGIQNAVANDRPIDQFFSCVINGVSAINENRVNVQTLERSFNEGIDRDMGNIVCTFEHRIQKADLTAIDFIIAPRIE